MNFLDLQNLVAYWLDDLAFGYFTTTQVKRWLNNAQFECWKKLTMASENYHLKCLQTTLVANQPDYALPDDFAKVSRLEIVTNAGLSSEVVDPILPITLNQQDLLLQQPAYPRGYYLKKNCLILVPKPDFAYTIRLFEVYRPGEMSNDNELPGCPPEFAEYIALLAARDGRLKDDRDISAIETKIKEYESLFDRMAEERNIDVPRMIISTDEGGGDYW